jgi:hypothetical protein
MFTVSRNHDILCDDKKKRGHVSGPGHVHNSVLFIKGGDDEITTRMMTPDARDINLGKKSSEESQKACKHLGMPHQRVIQQLVGFRAWEREACKHLVKADPSRETGKQASQESSVHAWLKSTGAALSPLHLMAPFTGGESSPSTSAKSFVRSSIISSGCSRNCPDCETRSDRIQPTCQICGFNFKNGVFEEDKVDLKFVMANIKFRGANGARAVSVPLLEGLDTPPSSPTLPSPRSLPLGSPNFRRSNLPTLPVKPAVPRMLSFDNDFPASRMLSSDNDFAG